MPLGMSTGIDEVHWLLDTALDARRDPVRRVPRGGRSRDRVRRNPLYAVLQEVIYHQGDREPGWAAQAEHDRWPTFAPTPARCSSPAR